MTYASTTVLSRSSYNRHRNQVTYKGRATSSLGNLIIVLVLIFVITLVYFLEINKTNHFSYVINDLRQEHAALEEDYQLLQIEAAKLRSNARVAGSLLTDQLTQPRVINFDTNAPDQ